MSETVQTTPEIQQEPTGIPWTNVAIWTAVLLVLGILGWGLLNSNKTRPKPGQDAPEFKMEFFDGYEWEGKPVANLSDFQGNVVVLNFWASWCVECRAEQDLLEATWKKYQGQPVVFLGITYADVEPNALAWLKDYQVTYPNAPDLGTSISADYEITGVPETFFIGKDGKIAQVQIGAVNEAFLTGTIEKLLTQGG